MSRGPWSLVAGLWTAALVACSLGAAGCVRRTLTIKTDPPGALVYVNDQVKGESPVSFDFLWYGAYRVMLRKDGYARVDDRKVLRAPLYLWIPLDLMMELLPVTIRDTRVWTYALSPAESLPTPVPPVTPGRQEAPAPADTTPAAMEETSDAPR